jgi:hypothetical protein
VSIDQIDAKVLRARRACRGSKRAIAAAYDDLQDHQLWLDRHRAAWAEGVRLYERRLGTKLRIRAFQRLALGIFLVGPSLSIRLYRLIARILAKVRSEVLARCAWRPIVGQFTSPRGQLRPRNRARHRIPGLDGPLCIGQPAAPLVIPKSEIGLLKVRLFVAAFGAVIVGFIAAAMIAPQVPPQSALVQPSRSKPLPTVASSNSREGGSASFQVTGFATLEATPAAELRSLPGATIAELISIASPLTVATAYSDAAAEPVEVTLPVRKPKIKIKAKPRRLQPKQKQITLRDRLPWLR